MLAKSKHSRAPSDDASRVACSRASRSVRSRSMSMRTSQSTLFGPKVRMAMVSSSDRRHSKNGLGVALVCHGSVSFGWSPHAPCRRVWLRSAAAPMSRTVGCGHSSSPCNRMQDRWPLQARRARRSSPRPHVFPPVDGRKPSTIDCSDRQGVNTSEGGALSRPARRPHRGRPDAGARRRRAAGRGRRGGDLRHRRRRVRQRPDDVPDRARSSRHRPSRADGARPRVRRHRRRRRARRQRGSPRATW